MKYATDDGSVVEWIWNSRDGVTPFCVTSRCGKLMSHVQWKYDIRILDYKPLPGERIFIDATPELMRPAAEKYIRQREPNTGGEIFESLVRHLLSVWLTEKGAPMVIEARDL